MGDLSASRLANLSVPAIVQAFDLDCPPERLPLAAAATLRPAGCGSGGRR